MNILFWIFIFTVSVDSFQYGRINDAYLSMIGTQYSITNSQLNDCVCRTLSSNGLIKAWNYFSMNRTCQFFFINTTFDRIQSQTNVLIGFLSIFYPLNQSSTSSKSVINKSWTFDGTFNDEQTLEIGTAMNNPIFVSPGITGRGSALNFNQSLNQSVMFDSTRDLNLSFSSFTFELWAFPYSFATATSGDRGIVGQCESLTANRCLHITFRSNQARMSFHSNALTSSARVVTNRWYHLAFVYDYQTTTQMIYIDGILDVTRNSAPPLQISNLSVATFTIGVTYPLQPFYYDGLIDELSVVGWTKNASEILDDATLVVYYSFNSNTSDGSTTAVNISYINSSILFNSSVSYFQPAPFVLLGTSNRSYSISIWINLLSRNTSAIVFSFQTNSSCYPMFTFSSAGNVVASSRSSSNFVNITGPVVPLNQWTHLVQTYSSTTGLSFYVNGTLISQSSSFVYETNGRPVTLTLGNVGSDCTGQSSQISQFYGWIDEFRVYSRVLSTGDIQKLMVRLE